MILQRGRGIRAAFYAIDFNTMRQNVKFFCSFVAHMCSAARPGRHWRLRAASVTTSKTSRNQPIASL